MKRLIACMFFVLLVSAGPALAGEFPAPYVEVKAGGDYSQIHNIRNTSDVADRYAVNKTSLDGWVGVIGGSAGVNFKSLGVPVRMELEYAYHAEQSYNPNPTYLHAAFPVALKSNVSSQTLFLNAYYDIDTGTAFTPYVGGGVGEAWNHTKATGTILATGQQETFHNTSDEFAWNLAAGCSYDITDNWKIDAGYRYMDLGKVVWGGPEARLTSKEVTAHEVTLGLRYQF